MVERVEAAVVEEEDAVGDVADAGELVGRDDERLIPNLLSNDERLACMAAREQGVVDQEDSIGRGRVVVQRSPFDE